MSAELQPSPQNREVTSSPFIRDVLKAKELETEEKREKYYYQMGYLYASGLLEKIYEWADSQQDSRILTSEDTSGRYAISVQWNFREVEGRKLCDEVGVAYIGEIGDTPMLKYEAEYPEEGAGYKQYYEEFQEAADFFLVWGQKPRVVRYFPHGKVEEALKILAEKGEIWEGSYLNHEVWDRMMVREVKHDVFDSVDIEKTEQQINEARLASGKKLEESLINAINNPKARTKLADTIRSPFKGDFGENTMQLFDRLESRIRKLELTDRIEEERRLYRREPTTSEKATAAFKSGAGYSYEEMLEQQLMEEEDAIAAIEEEDDFTPIEDHEACHQDESGYYHSEDLESHTHPQD